MKWHKGKYAVWSYSHTVEKMTAQREVKAFRAFQRREHVHVLSRTLIDGLIAAA